MTALSLQLGWLALRVTLVATIAIVFVWWSARRSARSAVVVLTGAMAICLALSATAVCPLPEFCRWSPMRAEAEHKAARRADDMGPIAPGDAGGFALAKLWDLAPKLSEPMQESNAGPYGSAILLALYGLGVAFAALRWFAGLRAARVLRRDSRPITEIGLLELVDSMRKTLGCTRRVELCECNEPGLAATFGWSRPVIFLPPEWRDWTLSERCAVLAHELSHVRYGDYLIGLVARLCQIVHFYNPLMYFLSAQLRWQQELAADDLAATVLANRDLYLKALASLALRSSARMSAGAMPWSAMTGGALLRRIEMLRGTKNGRPLGLATRGLLIGVLAGIAMTVATLGSPATQPDQTAEKTQPFEIGYLHPDAKGFVACRPAFLLRQPGMAKVSRTLAESLVALKSLGLTIPNALSPENIEEFVADFQIISQGTGKPRSRELCVGLSSVYLRLNQDFDWPAYFKNLAKESGALTGKGGGDVTEIRESGVTFYRLPIILVLGPTPVYIHMPDRRSVVFSGFARKASDPSTEFKKFQQLIQNVAQARQRDWGGYAKVTRAPIAAVVDHRDQWYAKVLANDLQPDELKLLENVRFATVGIEVGDGRPVHLILNAKSAAAAPALEQAVDVVARSVRAKLQQAKPEDENDKIVLKLATELLQSYKLHRDGARLEWAGFTSVRIHDLLEIREEKSTKEKTNKRPD